MLSSSGLKMLFVGLIMLSLFSCRSIGNNESFLKIPNGEEIETAEEDKYSKPVVMLEEQNQDGTFRGFCTATLVNDTTIITALHCIHRGLGTALPLIKVGAQYVQAVNSFYDQRGLDLLNEIDRLSNSKDLLNRNFFQRDQQCRETSAVGDILSQRSRLDQQISALYPRLPALDLAILVMPKGTGDGVTGGTGYYGVSTTAVKPNDNVKFIGFGHNTSLLKPGAERQTCRRIVDAKGFGKKREGTNTLSAQTSSSTLVIEGYRNEEEARKAQGELGDKVSLAPGDSGGPWVACGQSADCNSFDLIGVNSTAGFSNGSMNPGSGVPLLSQISRATFRKAIECTETDKSLCAANFSGSGVADVPETPRSPAIPASKDVYLQVAAGNPTNANVVDAQISLPASAVKVYFCVGSDYQTCDATASKPLTAVRNSQGNANKIYKITGNLILSETVKNTFSIVSRDAQGLLQHRQVLEVAKK